MAFSYGATHMSAQGSGGRTTRIAERLRHVERSPTLILAAAAKALVQAGHPVLDLTAGEPDSPTPAAIKEAGIQAIHADATRYTPVAGIPPLREAVAATISRMRGVAYTPSETIVTCGAKHALFNVCQALCEPGDEVLILSPYWVSFPPMVRLAGATPVIVPTREPDQFLPDIETVRQACSTSTRAIILNSPNNPTGAVMDPGRLQALATLAMERDLVVVSDEIYEALVYAPAQHVSMVQVVKEMKDRTVIVSGVSKSYSMTGWRIGYAAGPQPWIEAMETVQSHSTSNPTSISQYAALAALTGDQVSVAHVRQAFQERRDRLVNGLNRLAPLRCVLPSGAFYAWCNVQGLGPSSETIARQWLDEALVATVPGEGFGAPGFIRFSFATSLEVIDETLVRLATWLTSTHAARMKSL